MLDSSFSKQELGRRVAMIRGNHTQKELASAIGVSRSYISNIEQGLTAPSLEILINIAKQYRSSLDWLIYGDSCTILVPKVRGQQADPPNALLCRGTKAAKPEPACTELSPEIMQIFRNLMPDEQGLVIEFIKLLSSYKTKS
ncbi:helix-turn-helix domain-containing protein [Anaerosinus massiliensis]|uniref:helix-turn-helix domain-containing protein n=1 Tax=Massilibacillus massiliensis TaxID=1806837 RepID=UPI000DA62B0F|nr:transcriptional regulator [Massilibacillus massiliensis]